MAATQRRGSGSRTHGMSFTPTYAVWRQMIYRCESPTGGRRRYQGRGVRVCDRWRRFENFFADMGERPADRFLERIDNRGDYDPGNCKWATRSEQGRNKSSNRTVSYAGRTQCVSAWAEEVGMKFQTLYARIFTLGWDVERALSARVPQRHRKVAGP